jgi:hypothetical protein
MDKENKVRAKQHSSYWTFTILGLLLPVIGIILGIVYLTKKDLLDRKLGEHTIVMSIIGFVLTFVIIGVMGSSPSDKSSTTTKPSTTTTTPASTKTLSPEEQAKAEADAKAQKEAADKANNVPAEYKSALSQAGSYAKTMHMSKQGVYDQLVSEYGGKFSAEAAQYAIDNVSADWNANAVAQAKTYQNDMHLSPSAIHDQLTSPYGAKFTQAEADYAIQHLND